MNVTFKLSVGKSLWIFLFFFVSISSHLHAQDSLATIYFYRPDKTAESRAGYDIKLGDALIGRAKPKSVFTYHSESGVKIFKATTESESSFRLTVEAGKTYFVECGIAVGVTVGRPTFRLASGAEAKMEIARIDNSVASLIPASVIVIQPSDTVKALQHLFKRKRNGGAARAIVFGVLGLSSLINTIDYKPTTVTINQGSAGTQTIPIDDSPPVGNYIFIGFSTIMVITGANQAANYSTKNLDALIKDYNKRIHLPLKIKNKLKKKDFK
jgi:hypothetical protein